MLELNRIARFVGIAAMFLIYAVLVHYVNASGQPSTLGVILAVLPILAISLAMAAHSASRIAGILLLTSTLIITWLAWPLIARHTGFIFWVQDVSLQIMLMATFARTLLSGRTPLCVEFASMMHGPLSPGHHHYAHMVTIAWVIFFGLMAAISTLLFFMAPLTTWSIFANFLILPLTALMFALEYLARRIALPDVPSGHILDAVRAYRNASARGQ
ncbi:COG4648 family protein [Methyloradius palustris]|uniref:Transmembrane protein n=1 Tax=Methyloradius palustris TaxID=2778876 RepID=A0A8D5G8K8_9PROT|nr:hypothetical protein [Methyloradius palustris]BCM25131.1 hypothetical protein ZMTM_13900 [Methyloradius palustris]